MAIPTNLADIERFHVFLLEDKDQPAEKLPRQHPRFELLATAACLAVDMLTSSDGYTSFRVLCQNILESDQVNLDRIGRNTEDYKTYVNDYLGKINDQFPCIVITDLQSTNALTTRTDTSKLPSLVVRCAGVIGFNSRLLKHAEQARQAQELSPQDETAAAAARAIVFRIAVTLAHELCHIFVGYLLRNPQIPTPVSVTFGPGYELQGESGRFWEFLFFGSIVDMQMRPDGPSLALRKDNRNVYVISQEAISSLIYRDFYIVPLFDDDDWKKFLRREPAYIWSNANHSPYPGLEVRGEPLPRYLVNQLTAPHLHGTYGEGERIIGKERFIWLVMAEAS